MPPKSEVGSPVASRKRPADGSSMRAPAQGTTSTNKFQQHHGGGKGGGVVRGAAAAAAAAAAQATAAASPGEHGGEDGHSGAQILDFSFMELVELGDVAQVMPAGAPPSDAATSLKLNNNRLGSVARLGETCALLARDPSQIRWLDLSSNHIGSISGVFSAFPSLRSVNLHGNRLAKLHEVRALGALAGLRSLTLHGNPIAQKKSYRSYVLHFVPQITMLDYSGVTKADRAKAALWASTFRRKLTPGGGDGA